jgi:hypothetical protein
VFEGGSRSVSGQQIQHDNPSEENLSCVHDVLSFARAFRWFVVERHIETPLRHHLRCA